MPEPLQACAQTPLFSISTSGPELQLQLKMMVTIIVAQVVGHKLNYWSN